MVISAHQKVNSRGEMPRGFIEQYYSEAELREMVAKLNALGAQISPWRETSARKEHADLFGERIERGEVYFKREDGPAYDNNIKLSRLSMERFLVALFSGNCGLDHLASQIREDREQKRIEESRRFSPVESLLKNSDPANNTSRA